MMKGRSTKTNLMKKVDLVRIELDSGGELTIQEKEGKNRIRISCDGGSLLYIVPVVSNVAEIGCVDIVTKKKRRKK